MECPLHETPGEPPTAPAVLTVQGPKTFATIAWVEEALRTERRVMEARHIEFQRQFEAHLCSLSEPASEESQSAFVWQSGQLPGAIGDAEEQDAASRSVPTAQCPPTPNTPVKEIAGHLERCQSPPTPSAAGHSQDLERCPSRSLQGTSSTGKTALKRSQSRKIGQIMGEEEEFQSAGIIGFFERLVKSAYFEMTFSALIMANTIVMCFEAQYSGLVAGNQIGYSAAYNEPATSVWPGADDAFLVMEWWFGSVFALEIMCKIIGLRSQFPYDVWNGIDSIIVFSWFLTALKAVQLPLNPVMLRLCRLARLLRLVRLVRTIRGFDKLYLITTAMKGSASILIWTMMLMVIVQAMMSLGFQAVLEPYVIGEAPTSEAARFEVFKFYGTFARNMLTMFEITLGNWIPPARALVENVDEWYMVFFLMHKLVIGFALVSVINGVFIQETFKVAAMDDKVMMMQKERTAKAHSRKMHELFVHADRDGNGDLDKEEFIDAVEMPAIKQWLSAMELDIQDASKIFDLVDIDNDGTLSAEELVKGAGRLKGAARSIDVVSMIRDQKEIQREISELKRVVSGRRNPVSGS